MNTIPYLFVYGSLRSGFQNEAYNYISEYFKLVGIAKVKGFLINLGDYPVGISAESDNYIIGELYQLKNIEEHDWAMAQLDDYEGVNVEVNDIANYKRFATKVYCNEQEIVSWIYWYIQNVEGKPIIPSGDIFEFIKSK